MPGYAATQACHACLSFALSYPELTTHWDLSSGTLVTLALPVLDLYALADQVTADGTAHRAFYEPDLGDELTSVALLPSSRLRRALRRYPLLFATSRSEEHPFSVRAAPP